MIRESPREQMMKALAQATPEQLQRWGIKPEELKLPTAASSSTISIPGQSVRRVKRTWSESSGGSTFSDVSTTSKKLRTPHP